MPSPLEAFRPQLLSLAKLSTSDATQTTRDLCEYVEHDNALRAELAGSLGTEAVDLCKSRLAHSSVLSVLLRALRSQCAYDASREDQGETLSETCIGLARSACHSLMTSVLAENQDRDLARNLGRRESISILNDAATTLFNEFRISGANETTTKVLIKVLLAVVVKERPGSHAGHSSFAPAMAIAVFFLENDSNLDSGSVAGWRQKMIELLKTHLFSTGVGTAPPFEVQLCAPILCSLTQAEFDGVIARSLKFKLVSDPETAMVTAAALVLVLIESNGAQVRRVDFFHHFEKGAKLVPAAIGQLCSSNQESRLVGNDLLQYLLIASASHQSGAVIHSSAKTIVHHLITTFQSQGSIVLSRADQYKSLYVTLDQLGRTWLDLITKLGDENITLDNDDEQDLSSFVINFINAGGVVHDSGEVRQAAANALESWEDVQKRSGYTSGGPTSTIPRIDSKLQRLEQFACSKTMAKAEMSASGRGVSQPGALPFDPKQMGDSERNARVNHKLQANGMGTDKESSGIELEPTDDRPTDDRRDPSTRVIASRGITPHTDEPILGQEPNTGLAEAIAVPNEEYIYHAIEYDPNTKPSLMQNRRFITYGIGVFLLVVLIVPTLIVISRETGTANNIANIYVPVPTNPPTSKSVVDLLDKLKEISGEEVTKEGTPQYKARKWITNDDPMKLLYDDHSVIQRYILALIYFALGGDDWGKCSRDENSNECKYVCYTESHCIVESQCDAQSYDNFGIGTCYGFPYLSGESECNWGGVVCDYDGDVVEIELGDNNLHGKQLPHEISHLTYLHRFSIGFNQVKGTIPESFGDLEYMADLKINHNGLTGTVPEEIFKLVNLQKVEFNSNKLKGTISSQWGMINSLKGLWMWNNSFTGTLPEEIGNLNYLTHVGIYRNQLTGTLPTKLGKLTNLLEFYVNQNNFSGSIPAEIENWSDIEVIRFNDNQFKGTLPSELFGLTKLSFLDVGHNSLTGTLSTRIGELSNLKDLTLRANNFSGAIPAELSNLTAIDRLFLHWNDFKGTVPDAVCTLNFISLDTDCLDNTLECAEGCCTGCCHNFTRYCEQN
mmetsp:Transcript_47787/g.70724  ORF Transcript_47787/g.70724 Transcript_47787/m.70724 type:complete len:1068 (+) Transcript_47787:143-3346(+)|eukprot:CAMPEP_0195528278 /NCGR_PEP_ID=MMETSP0794_2-20130614/30350_1 /TAXON_ID=515487 /ORGANISM="Stephanopyxis turris, Strain CCMP 815" /LENGTH=1067 /DNA_ID=CAMNT_0040659393 /DNA_START=127 /DNA_END=3330 /DNA_ORIENTATION=-